MWTIQTAGYRFAPDGIAIKDDPGGAGIDPDPGVIGNGTKFVMINHQIKLGLIPYGVRVVRDSGPACPALDPFISNE